MAGMSMHNLDASLEAQLRNMILTNADAGGGEGPVSAPGQADISSRMPGGQMSPPNHPGVYGPRHHHPPGAASARGRSSYEWRGGHHHPHPPSHPRQQYTNSTNQTGNSYYSQSPQDRRGRPSYVSNRGGPVHMNNTYTTRSGPMPAPNRAQLDPNHFNRASPHSMQHRQPQLYHPQSHPMHGPSGPQFEAQSQYLDSLVSLEVARVEMSEEEISSKDLFRLRLEQICQGLKETHADKVLPSVTLQSFGSLSSGFASTGSDMDLAIVTDSLTSAEQKHLSLDENSLPRVLERALLDLGIGARLLTRTRVPIIKICETPSRELLDALLAERERWDALPDEEKYTSSNPANNDTASKDDVQTAAPLESQRELGKVGHGLNHSPIKSVSLDSDPKPDTPAPDQVAADSTAMPTDLQPPIPEAAKQRSSKQWKRERAAGPLDFPKQGVGIQCDINFFNPLGLFNTKLLRCYSKCDSRVRPMVLFIKTWAKHRKINSSYSGTLSSYGYVLMVLHYLVNIAKPPVLPNLQLEAARAGLPTTTFDGWDVRFLGDEDDIVDRAARGLITQNREPLGVLLRGFFQYFASTGGQGFIWMQNVLSLRTPGGILRKDEKGWTGAKTEVGDNHKEVRHRYLFAIEDPFELTHNVARTVTHNGIVAIRDEFRRSWRILQAVGRGLDPRDGELLAALDEDAEVIRTNPPTAPAAMTAPVETVKQNQPYAEAFPVLGLSSKPTISPQHAPIVRPDQTPASNKTRFPRHSNGNRSQRGARHGNPAGEGAPSLR